MKDQHDAGEQDKPFRLVENLKARRSGLTVVDSQTASDVVVDARGIDRKDCDQRADGRRDHQPDHAQLAERRNDYEHGKERGEVAAMVPELVACNLPREQFLADEAESETCQRRGRSRPQRRRCRSDRPIQQPHWEQGA